MTMTMTTMTTTEAYAKVNFTLEVFGKRVDGYHALRSVVVPISLSDTIEISPCEGGAVESDTGYPDDLCVKAARVLGCGGVSLHVDKRIPAGGGLGGGSADAAAVLIGLNHLWKTGLQKEELEKIGLSLGADVPFFIRGGLTRTRGIGEKLEDLDCLYDYRLIVVQPCSGLSTAQVFRLWHNTESICRPDTDKALHALKNGQLVSLCESIGNVLQPVAESLRPEIHQACQFMKELGALNAIMTGSGSAVFGVFSSETASKKAFQAMKKRYKTIFLCHTQHDSMRITLE